jgi:hypothetical protein
MPNKIKPKRSYTANSVPLTTDLETHELAINWIDAKAFTKNAAGNIVSVTLGGSGGGGGGGGSANIVEAATAAGFPATGATGTLYHATDVKRIYFWDAVGNFYVEAGPSGGGSSTDAALRALFIPAAPTSVSVTAGNAQAVVSWTAPTVLSQTPITDYTVQFQPSGGSFQTFTRAASTATSATVTGLTNGTAYVFRVAAVNAVGAGEYSSATSSVTPGDVFRAIPTMTSLTEPSGTVSGESNISESGSVGNELWRAFDGNSSTAAQFQRGPGNSPSRMIQYAFPDGQKSKINGYSITTPQPGYVDYFSQWIVYGSDDLSTWTEIDSRSGVSGWTSQQAKTFTLSQTRNFRAYRWVFQSTTDNSGPNQISTLALTE